MSIAAPFRAVRADKLAPLEAALKGAGADIPTARSAALVGRHDPDRPGTLWRYTRVTVKPS
ncbi:MAG: hypothetical protein V3U35_01235 [Candidatus Neomarinimicrobiota bacterium]